MRLSWNKTTWKTKFQTKCVKPGSLQDLQPTPAPVRRAIFLHATQRIMLSGWHIVKDLFSARLKREEHRPLPKIRNVTRPKPDTSSGRIAKSESKVCPRIPRVEAASIFAFFDILDGVVNNRLRTTSLICILFVELVEKPLRRFAWVSSRTRELCRLIFFGSIVECRCARPKPRCVAAVSARSLPTLRLDTSRIGSSSLRSGFTL